MKQMPGDTSGSPQAMGWLGVATDLVFAAGLAILLAAMTTDRLDFVPRPLALLFLFGAPGVVAACGLLGRRRSLVGGAGAALLVAAPLSFTGITAIFLIPTVLLVIAAARLGPAPSSRGVELLEGGVIAALLVGAGIALLSLTAETCAGDVGGEVTCGTGVLTVTGVAIELALQATAVLVAVWRSGLAARLAARLAGRAAS